MDCIFANRGGESNQNRTLDVTPGGMSGSS